MKRHKEQTRPPAKDSFRPTFDMILANGISANPMYACAATSIVIYYEMKIAGEALKYPKITIAAGVTSKTRALDIIRGRIDRSLSEKKTEKFKPMDIEEFRRIYLADADENEMQMLFMADMWQEVLDRKISKIKYYRIINELTQQSLAEKLGMQQPNMARIEKIGYVPDMQTFKKLAEIFGIDYKELLD